MEYYVLDVETTGLKAGFHETTQISIVRCNDRHQLSKYIAAEYPERANYESLRITGRTLNDIIKGDSKKVAIDAFNNFLLQDEKTTEHRCMVGHNVSFDRRFVHALWGEFHQPFLANLWLDTKSLTGQLAKKMGMVKPKLTLESSLKIADIKNVKTGAHNAIVDTQNTYKLWKDLVERHEIDYLPLIKRCPHKL